MPAKNGTTDAVEIMHRLFVEGNPEEIALLEAERLQLEISLHIHDLRTSGGQTQEEFAALVGLPPNTINALETWNYEGDAFAMLAHIEKALWEHSAALDFPTAGVYSNALLGATITGCKLTLFRYHPGRKKLPRAVNFGMARKTERQYLLNEFAPWQDALKLNRQELQMFARAGMNEWCHLSGGLRVNFSGDAAAYIRAVDIHAQLVNAAVYCLQTGDCTALKEWRQAIGVQEAARYLSELETALHLQTFAHFPDTEWLTQTLIEFANSYQDERKRHRGNVEHGQPVPKGGTVHDFPKRDSSNL